MNPDSLDFSSLPLDQHAIEQRLPHAGKMSLLQSVTHADINCLTAKTKSHLDADNPLRIAGEIASINGVEYAAQAMAIHGSLLSDKPQAGYIATVRNIVLDIPFLPQSNSYLVIEVEQLMSDTNGFTYQFQIHCQEQSIISGKITVFLM